MLIHITIPPERYGQHAVHPFRGGIYYAPSDAAKAAGNLNPAIARRVGTTLWDGERVEVDDELGRALIARGDAELSATLDHHPTVREQGDRWWRERFEAKEAE